MANPEFAPTDEPSPADAVSAVGDVPNGQAVFACLLFLASGIAGLIYEVVWVRELTARLGAGLYAVSAVLAAFMGGLAFGAAVAGRLGGWITRPFFVYAVLELLIAVSALLLPTAWGVVETLDRQLYEGLGEMPIALAGWRFVCALGVLLIPTSLMGATLPCLAHGIVVHRRHLGMRVGGLYAVNTLGAVAGAFLTGFWLLERFGVTATSWIAAALNLLAGAGALALWLRTRSTAARGLQGQKPQVAPPSVDPEVDVPSKGLRRARSVERADADAIESASEPGAHPSIETETTPAIRHAVLLGAFLTGMAALAAEVLWARSLSFVFDSSLKNTTYCFSAMLTVFLAGLGLGSAAIGWLADRIRAPLRLYGWLLAAEGASLALSVVIIDLLIDRETSAPATTLRGAVTVTIWRTVAVLGLPTLIMGMIFPVAVKIFTRPGDISRDVARLYSVNTLGAVVGAVAAPFVLVPVLGVGQGLIALALTMAVFSFLVLGITGGDWKKWVALAMIGGFALGTGLRHGNRPAGMLSLAAGETLIHLEESSVATVSVIESDRGERRICVDEVPVAGTSPLMQTDQKSLAHLPLALLKAPRRTLTVGFGSGGASYSFLLHDRLEHVHCVEICPAVVRAAPHLTAANHGFLERNDPRYRIIFDDARAYLRCTSEVYDVISTDCTDLRYKSSANLYDLEYFDLCRQRLTPNGLVVVWMPLGGLSDRMFRTTLRTFSRVFPETAVFYMHNQPTHYVLLVGWRDRLSIDYRTVAAAYAEDDVRADLEEIGLGSPRKLLATFVSAGKPLADYLAGDLLNTQDRPVLEFEGPRYMGLQRASIVANLERLLDHRASVFDWIDPASIDAAQRESLEKSVAAFFPIVEAQRAIESIDIEGATRSYLRALALTPDDASLEEALKFRQFVPLAEQGNPTVWALLGRSQQLQEHHAEAVEYFERFFAGCAGLTEGPPRGMDYRTFRAIEKQAETWKPMAQQWHKQSTYLARKAREASQEGSKP
jgi:spermidine synthase